MSLPRQPGFFDVDERAAKLTARGDPLVKHKAEIDFEAFRADLKRVHQKDRKSNAGVKPFDVVLMFRVLILQHLYNLSDDGIEYQMRDRLSFRRVLGRQREERVPAAKTGWLFRERLSALGLVEVLLARFDEPLAERGYVAKTGPMSDATFVAAPRQRNRRAENAKITAGETPDGWDDPEQAARRRQTATEARWTKKNDETPYGYQNHINADAATKLIQDSTVTPANGHDSPVFEVLLDTETTAAEGRKRPVSADRADRSEKHEQRLEQLAVDSQSHEQSRRAAPLTAEQPASNRTKAKVRARVEPIVGAQAARGGPIVRTIGIERAQGKVGLMNLTYHMKRRVPLTACEGRQLARSAAGQHRRAAPAMA